MACSKSFAIVFNKYRAKSETYFFWEYKTFVKCIFIIITKIEFRLLSVKKLKYLHIVSVKIYLYSRVVLLINCDSFLLQISWRNWPLHVKEWYFSKHFFLYKCFESFYNSYYQLLPRVNQNSRRSQIT